MEDETIEKNAVCCSGRETKNEKTKRTKKENSFLCEDKEQSEQERGIKEKR